ncbi:MAG TPA: hypothetical protein VHV08_11645, partial [Pirellulales bacterium]|nr:hypothetical protein [Pirellulales bacterium]
MNARTRLLICLAWLSAVMTVCQAGGQVPAAAPSDPTSANAKPAEDLKAERDELGQRVLLAQRTLDAMRQSHADQSPTGEQIAREVDLLKQLDTLYAQRQSAIESQQELRANQTDLNEQLAKLRERGPSEERPYSFLLLDGLRDKLVTEKDSAESIADAVRAAADELEHAKKTSAQSQAERRQLKEATSDDKNQAKAQGAAQL